jgi:hypothetical protein
MSAQTQHDHEHEREHDDCCRPHVLSGRGACGVFCELLLDRSPDAATAPDDFSLKVLTSADPAGKQKRCQLLTVR